MTVEQQAIHAAGVLRALLSLLRLRRAQSACMWPHPQVATIIIVSLFVALRIQYLIVIRREARAARVALARREIPQVLPNTPCTLFIDVLPFPAARRLFLHMPALLLKHRRGCRSQPST